LKATAWVTLFFSLWLSFTGTLNGPSKKKKKKKKKIVNFTLVLGHFNGEVLLAAGCSSCISLAPAATAAAATHLMVLWEGLIQPTLGWSFMAKVVCCRHLLFLSPFSLFSFLWFSLSHGFFPDHFFFFFFFASSFLLTPLPPSIARCSKPGTIEEPAVG